MRLFLVVLKNLDRIVAKYGDMSHVVVKCIDGFMDHPSFTCHTKHKKQSRGHRKNNRKN